MKKIYAILYFCSFSTALFPATWNLNANGLWNLDANWTTPAIFPNAIDAQAIFGNVITANRTVTLGIPITAGDVSFDDNNNYLVTASTLTFQVTVGNALLTLTNVNGNGAHTIASAVSLASTLNMTHSSPTNFTISGAIGGAGSLIKNGAGPGSLVLSNAANAYGGSTTINQGTLSYSAAGAIPTTSTVTIGDGVSVAQLTIAANMALANAFPVTINTNGRIAPNINITTHITSVQGAGTVQLTTGSTATNLFNIEGTTSTTFTGNITGGLASASTSPEAANRLTKGGTSTLILTSAASDYVSRTFVANGILEVQNSNALGAGGNNSGVFVRAIGTTGTVVINGSGFNINKRFLLNGAGFSSGALRNTGGNNTISGNIQIGWTGGTEVAATAATINVDAGTELTASAVVSGASNLTLTGGGTLVYTGGIANTMSATTTVSSGTLQLNKTTGINALAGNADISAGGILLLSAANEIINTATVTLNGGTFNMAGNAETIGTLVFNSGTLTQGGATLSLASAVTGLSMNDATTITGPIAFTAAGAVIYNGVATRATISGDVNLGTTIHIFNIADGADTVDMEITGAISGTGGVTKSTGTGVLRYSGSSANTYTGLTTLNAGSLNLAKTGVNAINDNITINAGGTLLLEAANQIVDNSVMTLAGGTFNMAGNAETIGRLIFNSGTLTQGGATLSLSTTGAAAALTMGDGTLISGNIALTGAAGNSGVTYNGVAATATISGNLDLGTQIRTFNIADGAAVTDMEISGVISGTGGIQKLTSLGRLDFTGTSGNTYTGTTTISAGILFLNKTVGNAIAGNISINNAAGTLTLGNSNQIADTSTVTLANGTFDMSGFSDTIGSFTYNSGTFIQAGGILSLASAVTALTMRNTTITGTIMITNGGAIVFDDAVNGTGTISGTLDLGTITPNFSIQNGTAATDMLVSGVITSSGAGLTKITGGLLEFAGAASNTYTGLTTVSAGTLLLNKGGGATAIPGNAMVSGGTLLLGAAAQISDTSTVTIAGGTFNLAGFAETIASLIFNSGTLTQGGATLSLASPVTALTMRNTTISGTIAITAGGEIVRDPTSNGTATISGIIDLGAITPNFNIGNGTATNDMTVSGVITSAGAGFTKLGAGRLQLSGAASNTYTGLTTVTGDTLFLNKSGGATAIPGDMLINGGTVLLGAPEQIANISVTTLDSGTFNLSGDAETLATFNFNGGTFTQGGATLSLASAVTALSMRNTTITGNLVILSGGAVVFDNTNNGTAQINGNINLNGMVTPFNIAEGSADTDMLITGIISNGSLTKIGAGKLVLTGANNYAGGTLVSAGTLQGDTTSLQGNITDNATLIFDQTVAGTYASSLSGTGTLIKQGPGSLTLSNVNSISGNVLVNEGTLFVNGTLAGGGPMDVVSGATLAGTGTITKDITVHGNLEPGNSIGTINLIGAQVFAAGSTLEIEVNPVSNDLVDITGTLTIQPGAGLFVIPQPGMYAVPSMYTIIHTTGGVTGTFSVVEVSLPFITESVFYTPFDVLLELFFRNFSELITSGNAAPVARCLDTLPAPSGSDMEAVVNVIQFLPTLAAVENALLQMQPSAFTALAIAQEDDTLYVNNAVFNRLDAISCLCDLEMDDGCYLWVSPLGAYTLQGSKHQEPGFRVVSPGVVMGFDGAVGCQGYLGGSVSYTYSQLHWKESRGTSHVQTVYGGLYGKWQGERGYLEGALMGAYNFYHISRHIEFGSIDRHAVSSHQGQEGSAHLKAALTVGNDQTMLAPYLRLDYIYLHENSFKERGAQSLNLKVESKNSDLLCTEAGIGLYHCWGCGCKIATPFIEVSMIRESRFMGKTENGKLDGRCPMEVKGLNPSRTLGGLTVGCNVTFPSLLSEVSVFYRGRYGENFQDHSGYVQFILEF